MIKLIQEIITTLTLLTASLSTNPTVINKPVEPTFGGATFGAVPICIDQYTYVSEKQEGSNFTRNALDNALNQILTPTYTGNIILNIYQSTPGRGFQIISKTVAPAPTLSTVATSTP